MISKAITLAHSFLVIAENNQYAFAVKPLGYALGVVVIIPLYPSKGSVSVVGLNFVYAHNHVINITQGVGHPLSYQLIFYNFNPFIFFVGGRMHSDLERPEGECFFSLAFFILHAYSLPRRVGHPPSYLKKLSINFFLDAKWGPRVIGHNGR